MAHRGTTRRAPRGVPGGKQRRPAAWHPFEEATDLEQFVQRPTGRYFVADAFLIWCCDPSLSGSVWWGRPDESDVRLMMRASEVLANRVFERPRILVDVSEVVWIEPPAFEALARFWLSRSADLGSRMSRLALVRPGGVAGALVAGFQAIAPLPCSMRVLAERAGAIAWLGMTDRADVFVEVDRLRRVAQARSTLLHALRGLLARHYADATPSTAAREIGVSVRSLQREVARSGTTFRAELARARINAARGLLLQTATSVTRIAMDVGCATPQHFSQLFRRITGETPTAWRSRRVHGSADTNVIGA